MSYFTEEQLRILTEKKFEQFRLAVKKLDPQIFYQALDLASKKEKLFECSNCGGVVIGKCDVCINWRQNYHDQINNLKKE